MSYNAISPVFNVHTSHKLDSIRDFRVQNTKNMYGGIHLSGIPMNRINPYTWACLQIAVEKYSKCGKVASLRDVCNAVKILQGEDNVSRDKAIEICANLCCDSKNTLILDSAVAFAMSGVKGQATTPETVEHAIADTMRMYGISCRTSDGRNYSGIERAKIPTLGESISHAIADGNKAYPSILLMTSISRRESSMSGIWPVDYPEDIYKSALGLSGLNGETATTTTKSSWEDVLKDLSAQAGKASISLAEKFGQSKIERADLESKLYLEQAYKKSTGSSSFSESDLDDFAAANPSEAKSAMQKAYANQGISMDDIAKAIKDAKKDEPNWPLIIGAGAGGLVLVGLLVFAIARK